MLKISKYILNKLFLGHEKARIPEQIQVRTGNLDKKKNPHPKKRVFVGMSGGVDSSVSAALLKEQGYDVTGVFIKVWQPDETDCGWKDERRDAMRVAAQLDIPFLTVDLSDAYKKEVADYMISEYKVGRTPNPDIMCNRYVKFGAFWEFAQKAGADYVATGHYAQNIFNKKTGLFELHEGKDTNKDQSYFLWTLTDKDLPHVLFPVGHLVKSKVRDLAYKFNLPVFDKKDSQGVCFIGHLDMKDFLTEYAGVKKGAVLNLQGVTVGEHDGAILYTLGERHGFRIQNTDTKSEARYVIKKDIVENTITVATEREYEEQIRLFEQAREISKLYIASDVVDSAEKSKKIEQKCIEIKCQGRIRYRQERQDLVLKIIDLKSKTAQIVFTTPQKGVAAGQSLVLYSGTRCIGGGILEA